MRDQPQLDPQAKDNEYGNEDQDFKTQEEETSILIPMQTNLTQPQAQFQPQARIQPESILTSIQVEAAEEDQEDLQIEPQPESNITCIQVETVGEDQDEDGR